MHFLDSELTDSDKNKILPLIWRMIWEESQQKDLTFLPGFLDLLALKTASIVDNLGDKKYSGRHRMWEAARKMIATDSWEENFVVASCYATHYTYSFSSCFIFFLTSGGERGRKCLLKFKWANPNYYSVGFIQKGRQVVSQKTGKKGAQQKSLCNSKRKKSR